MHTGGSPLSRQTLQAKNRQKTTIADIAAAAGVSSSTVSRALRDHPRLPTTTCQRIKALAEAMEYRPDPLISALLARRHKQKGGEIGTIAFITSFPTRDGWRLNFAREAYEGANAQALKCGYQVEIFWLREPKMTQRRLSEILRSRGIRGVLLAPLPHAYGHLRLDWKYFSCATIGYSMIRPSLHRATPHHFQNTLMALRSLRQLGHRRVGIIIRSLTHHKVGGNYLAAALFFRDRYGADSLPVFILGDGEAKLRSPELEAWIKQEKLSCIYSPEGLSIYLNLFSEPYRGFVATQTGVEAEAEAYIDEKPRLVGAAAVDLVVGQIQRNETGIPTDPKVVMIEGKWVQNATKKPSPLQAD